MTDNPTYQEEEQDKHHPMMGMGECAVCGRKCPVGYLMCGAHWRRVPRHLQHEVYNALAAWEGGAPLEVLRDVQMRAVDAVRAKL